MFADHELPTALDDLQRAECETYLEYANRWHDSYQRLPALLKARLKSDIFFACLGSFWSVCDNVAQNKRALSARFRKASRRQLNLMMSDDELAEWGRLPSKLLAYRFAYDNNLDGFSYSLKKEVAIQFSTYHRYRQEPNRKMFIIKVSVPKQWTVLKLDRDEFEVIISEPRRATRLISTRLV